MLGLLHDLLLSEVFSVVGHCTTSMSHLSGLGVKRVFEGWKRATVQFKKCNCSVDFLPAFFPGATRLITRCNPAFDQSD
jgi:hypothetical protein